MNEVALREAGAIVNFEEQAMSVDSLVRQVALIQEVMGKVMKTGEHYGTIPGCGDKPTLLKPGAEKLGFTFRLAPEFEVEIVDHPEGHREYQIKCRLRHIPTQVIVGEGVGTCTTMEGKYRYRWDNSGVPVPGEYWKTRDKDLLGGPFNAPRKIDGKWFIFQRVEHDNPADYYNTCEKMAKKRAHVDAILMATAASDLFTQDDIEDLPQAAAPVDTPEPPAMQKPQAKAPETAPTGDGDPVSENQIKAIHAMLKALGIADDMEKHQTVAGILGLSEIPTSFSTLTKSQASAAIKKLSEGADAKRKAAAV